MIIKYGIGKPNSRTCVLVFFAVISGQGWFVCLAFEMQCIRELLAMCCIVLLTFSQFCKHSEEEVHTGQKQGGLNVSQKSLSDDIFEKSLSDEILFKSLLFFFSLYFPPLQHHC